jgi:AcrR family transcriptional regulator
MIDDSTRREEILATAATLFASSGIRTTLRDIADACGILPGSLYHHFDSKEAIIVELVQRYRDDLDEVAKGALDSLHEPDQQSIETRVVGLGRAIALCAIRNRAAVLLTQYEPPTVSGDELIELASQSPSAVNSAMLELLATGRASGVIRGGFDLGLLAERICQSMIHMAVGVYHRSRAAEHLPEEKCEVYLHGVATRAITKSFDRSAAMRAAREVVASWDGGDDDGAAVLRSIARAEFARRGFEATTVRDIAKAAGTSTGSVYRQFRSKDELLLDIMQTYSETAAIGWETVMQAPSPALERLDALIWMNDNLIHHFSEEFKIQIAWLRQSPPTSIDLGLSFNKQMRQLQRLLGEGEREGDVHVPGRSLADRARSMYELMLTPNQIVASAGVDGAHALARETVLRGAMAAGSKPSRS